MTLVVVVAILVWTAHSDHYLARRVEQNFDVLPLRLPSGGVSIDEDFLAKNSYLGSLPDALRGALQNFPRSIVDRYFGVVVGGKKGCWLDCILSA